MFNQLNEKLGAFVRHISRKSQLNEKNIQEALTEVRNALIDGDVALEVVEQFCRDVATKAAGQKVIANLKPGEAFVGIVQQELLDLMSDDGAAFLPNKGATGIILLAGLQGSGKTTTAAKLAHHFIAQERKVVLAGADVFRPAAIEQLAILAERVGAKFLAPPSKSMKDIAKAALSHVNSHDVDILIVDSAGRQSVDSEMMEQLRQLRESLKPSESLFVVDALSGQDALQASKAFSEVMQASGIILSKADADVRGGAVLSAQQILKVPIRFMGTGEAVDQLEIFDAERMVSRILGMGDVLSLVEKAQKVVDEREAERLSKRMQKQPGQFNLNDLLLQLQSVESMGGTSGIMEALPNMGQGNVNAVEQSFGSDKIKKMQAIIFSMTPQERLRPEIINGSRKKRIAKGAGANMLAVNQVLKKHKTMRKTLKKAKRKGGFENMFGDLGDMP